MSIEGAVTFFIIIFIFGITPGPGIFAILARALVHGMAPCFWLALGMAVSDMLYLIFACLGLAALAEHWEGAFTVIRWLGAGYLCYIGWKLWTTPVILPSEGSGTISPGWVLSLVQGFLISASNPKVILFYIAFLPTFMDLSVLSVADITLASVLTIIGLMLGLMLVAGFASAARGFFTSMEALERLNRTAGSIMIGAGVYLVGRH